MGRWMEDVNGTEVCRDCGCPPADCRCAEDEALEDEHRALLAAAYRRACDESEYERCGMRP
jgi:hypothetical protein